MNSNSDDILIALRRIMRATDLHSRKLNKEAGLTAPQLLVLQAVNKSGRIAMGDIAREVSLSQATVTTILDRLEKRDLLIRERGQEDKRRVYAALTDQGKIILEQAPAPLQQEFSRRFHELKDWEQSLLLSSLQRIASLMDAENLDASPVLDVGAIDRQQTPPAFMQKASAQLADASPLSEATQKESNAKQSN